MISEGLKGAFSILKLRREILWLGDRDEAPPKEFSSILTKIQFLPLSGPLKTSAKTRFPILVLSLGPSSDVSADLLQSVLSTTDESTRKFLVFNEPNSTLSLPKNLQVLTSRLHFDRIFSLPGDSGEMLNVMKIVLDESLRAAGAQEERRKVRTASQKLESKTMDLEDQVKERTQHLQLATKEVELKVSRMRKLIRFLKELSVATSVEDVLTLIRQEIKVFHQVKDPILVFHNSSGEVVALYLQGTEVMSKLKLEPWPQIQRSRLNDNKDSLYLANAFGRPFAKVLAIPLSIQRSSDQKELGTPGVLFLEHALDEDSRIDFLQFVEERLPALSVALDRVFLEADMTEASHLWEKTFDGISDPVAIFDADGKRVRANRAFQDRLSGLEAAELFHDILTHGDRVYEVQTYPIAGGADEVPTNIVVHYVDVTLAHQLQKRMIQHEKMAALGHLAGHVAHELNNPLTGIRSLSQVLISQLPEDSRVRQDLTEVERAAERCQAIIKNLLDFSKGGVENRMVSVRLNDVVSKTLPLLKTLIGHYDSDINLADENLVVVVEPQLLQQVVFNLIKNACQAMEGSGRLGIETRREHREGRDWAVLTVADTGVGIAPEVQEQIFDFFFTTKQRGQGTGLGLSMSKSIVESFGGQISVKSQLGQGSEFEVRLPLGAEPT